MNEQLNSAVDEIFSNVSGAQESYYSINQKYFYNLDLTDHAVSGLQYNIESYITTGERGFLVNYYYSISGDMYDKCKTSNGLINREKDWSIIETI